jgi:hypothetical protein
MRRCERDMFSPLSCRGCGFHHLGIPLYLPGRLQSRMHQKAPTIPHTMESGRPASGTRPIFLLPKPNVPETKTQAHAN